MSNHQWPITEKIAEYSSSLKFDDLPATAILTAKDIVLDTLGAIFAAWPDRQPVSRIMGEFVKQMGGTPECTVLGHNFKAPAANAALANGVMGYAADIEGAGVYGIHAAAVFVPTALTMGERQALDGKSFITALALAYDMSRVSKANLTKELSPKDDYPHSFHHSAVYGTFGAAAIAGYALGLDPSRFINAYGLAGNVASGLIAWVDDPTEHSRSYGIGVAARNGVTASLLAEKGFGGPRGIFDPMKYNIFDAFSGEMHLEELTDNLGNDFYIEHAEGFKKYGCCADIHSGIESLLGIMDEQSLTPDQIARITFIVRPINRRAIDNNPLHSHNAQYILALAAVDREIRWDAFIKDRSQEPLMDYLIKRINLTDSHELDDSPGRAPAIVEVRTLDNRVLTKRVDIAKGLVGNPFTKEELHNKFVELATQVLSEERALEIIQTVERLETLTDIREIIELMH